MGKKKTSKTKEEKDLIDQLVDERKARKLTQEEMARVMGCPQPSISRIERRVSSPTLEFVEKMCNVLGVKIFIGK